MKSAKMKWLPFVLFLFISYSISAEENLHSLLVRAVEDFAKNYDQPLVASIGNFTFTDKAIGSSFSCYIAEMLGGVLSDHKDFDLFAREKLDKILEIMELNLSDLVDEKTTPRAGELKGIQVIFSGRYFDEGTSVRIFIEMVNIEEGTGEKKELSVSKAAIPGTISLLPENYNDALYIIDELYEVQNAGNSDFIVKAWTTRGEGGVYKNGDQMVIHFYANRDCFIKLYHIDVNRKMRCIFPNQYSKNNFVEGRQVYKIPDNSAPFKFDLSAPYGVEIIKVIASTVQFDDIEKAFEEIGTVSKEIIKRGLSVNCREEQVTETIISYTIVEK